MNTLFNKVLGENENCLLFLLKNQWNLLANPIHIQSPSYVVRVQKEPSESNTRKIWRRGWNSSLTWRAVEADGGGEQSLEDRGWEGGTDRAHSGLEGAPGCMAGFILERSRNKRGVGG